MRVLVAFVSAVLLWQSVPGSALAQGTPDPANTVTIQLKSGRVSIRLRPDLAPKHVARIKRLVAEGFYDGLTFHRVIPGFMVQTGDPRGDGTGGSHYPNLPAEFSSEPFRRGSVGAARTRDPNSANSQFFICFGDGCRHLTGQYTLWGQVVAGMEHVDAIKTGDPGRNGMVTDPDRIVKMTLAGEARK